MAEEQKGASAASKQLAVQKIYVKDISFESPRSPAAFSAHSTPQTQLNISSSSKQLGADLQEVVLTVTVETKEDDKTLFLIELQQAGLFVMQGYSSEERAMLIGSYCPAMLYPFAREVIADIVTKGGFPQLLLQPINFDALYAQALRERAERGREPRSPEETH